MYWKAEIWYFCRKYIALSPGYWKESFIWFYCLAKMIYSLAAEAISHMLKGYFCDEPQYMVGLSCEVC